MEGRSGSDKVHGCSPFVESAGVSMYNILFCLFSISSLCETTPVFKIEKTVFDTGGSRASSCSYTVKTAIGQPCTIGSAEGENYRARFGFLSSLAANPSGTGIDKREEEPLVNFLFPCSPNPAVGEVNISYSLKCASKVLLRIYDVTGRVVRTLAHGKMKRGRYCVPWDGRDKNGREAPCGSYFYSLNVDGRHIDTRRLVLMQ